MIGQYLSQTNESATVPVLQNFLELNKPLVQVDKPVALPSEDVGRWMGSSLVRPRFSRGAINTPGAFRFCLGPWGGLSLSPRTGWLIGTRRWVIAIHVMHPVPSCRAERAIALASDLNNSAAPAPSARGQCKT